MSRYRLPDLPWGYGRPGSTGRIKVVPEDFQVEEQLGFEPAGDGEHLFLWVEKRGQTTERVAETLARLAAIPRNRISYAGLKDRQALTRQWFSLHLPGQPTPPWRDWQDPSFTVQNANWHLRKLKKGAHKSNRFTIRIRDFSGDRLDLERRLRQIGASGFPNYFGPQRFGRDGDNVTRAMAWLKGRMQIRSRHLQGLYLSSVRAYLFNEVLAARILRQTWNRPIEGDRLMFDGSGAFFKVESIDSSIEARVAQLLVHPTGPLWGNDGHRGEGAGPELEWEIADRHRVLSQALEDQGFKPARRPLRCRIEELQWEWLGGGDLTIGFRLGAGSYATSMLRELIDMKQM